MSQSTFPILEPKVISISSNNNYKCGNKLEDLVEHLLRSYGYRPGNHTDCPSFVRQHPIKNWCQAEWLVDFRACNPKKFPQGILIECKWQFASGSAEDKLLATLTSFLESGQDSLLLVCGGGVSPAIIQELERRSFHSRVEVIVTFDNFMIWAKDHL
jgi:hypothetical protein